MGSEDGHGESKQDAAGNGEDQPADKEKTRIQEFRHWWTRLAPPWQVAIAVGMPIGVIGIWAAAVNIWQNAHHYQQEHRPRIEIDPPPTLWGPITCTTTPGALITSGLSLHITNNGDRTASNVRIGSMHMWVSPMLRADYESMPTKPASCEVSDKTVITAEVANIPAETPRSLPVTVLGGDYAVAKTREEASRAPRLEFQTVKPIKIFFAPCVYYSDEYGREHGTCETFNLMDADGNNTFACDTQIFAAFHSTVARDDCAT